MQSAVFCVAFLACVAAAVDHFEVLGLSRDGLPLAIQLIGWPNGESDLFRAAAWCERTIQAGP